MLPHKVAQIEGINFTQTKSVTDSRGTFIKFHPLENLKGLLDSVALSINPKLGTIRGLHFQTEPFAEEKLITCIQGSIFDVIIDLRPNSKTFGKWTSFELSAENALQAYLPKGIAHGFQTLRPNTIVHYGLSPEYSPESSYVIDSFGDRNIDWPIKDYHISERDTAGITFSSAAQKYSDSIMS